MSCIRQGGGLFRSNEMIYISVCLIRALLMFVCRGFNTHTVLLPLWQRWSWIYINKYAHLSLFVTLLMKICSVRLGQIILSSYKRSFHSSCSIQLKCKIRVTWMINLSKWGIKTNIHMITWFSYAKSLTCLPSKVSANVTRLVWLASIGLVADQHSDILWFRSKRSGDLITYKTVIFKMFC